MSRVAETRAWVRDLVRSGLLDVAEARREVREVLAVDHPQLAASTADAWVAEEYDAWRADAREWSRPTDFELLQQAFGRLEQRGLLVLQGCADHWVAKAALEQAAGPAGALWFTPPDVWHAQDQAMLEVNLWHPDTANAAPGDPLLDEVLEQLGAAGLAAHFDEGRIEIAARWLRPPPVV